MNDEERAAARTCFDLRSSTSGERLEYLPRSDVNQLRQRARQLLLFLHAACTHRERQTHRILLRPSLRLSSTILETKATSPPGVIISFSAPVHFCDDHTVR